jgi:hypothetical protein
MSNLDKKKCVDQCATANAGTFNSEYLNAFNAADMIRTAYWAEGTFRNGQDPQT